MLNINIADRDIADTEEIEIYYLSFFDPIERTIRYIEVNYNQLKERKRVLQQANVTDIKVIRVDILLTVSD